VNVPVAFVPIVKVALPDPVILVGLIMTPIPVDGVTVRETVPLNPLRLVSMIVE
jgi:hypothetical protein